MSDSFKYVNLRRLAELEYDLRIAEIDLMEHEDTYPHADKFLVGEILKAKVKLAKWKVQDWISSRLPNWTRIPEQS